MPELLLSSSPQKHQKSNPLLDTAKPVEKPSKSGLQVGSEGPAIESKKEGRFNNILTSIVEESNTSESLKPSNEELVVLKEAIQKVTEELAKIDPDSEYLSELQNLLEGQDITTFTGETSLNGLGLPELLNSLQAIIEKMTQSTSEIKVTDQSNDVHAIFELEESSALMASVMNLSQVVGDLSNKPANKAELPSSLLGFSFTSGKNTAGKWQQYDPQQMSQAPNLNQNGQIQGNNPIQNGQISGLVTEQLMPESDKNFQTQMSQLLNETMKDSTAVSDTLIDTLVDNKEKPLVKFSELQLRTPNDGLKQYSTTLTTPVNSQQWSEEVSQKIVWFTGRNIQAAEMHLNPADLGPIDVKIHVQNDVASVTFNVNNASVRDLLESNVVRLREMIEANGVNVGEVNIDSGSREQSHSGEKSDENGLAQSGQADKNSDLLTEEQEIQVKQTNLVDYFV